MRNKPRIGQELLDVPMGDMIRQMAFAIAEAQLKLDENSIEVAQMMGGLKTIYNDDGEVSFTDSRVFFGKEKVTLGNVIDLFNSSNDASYKAELLKTLEPYIDKITDSNNTIYNNVFVTSSDAPLPAHTDTNKIYIKNASLSSATNKYFRFIGFDSSSGTPTPNWEELSLIEVLKVKSKTGFTPTTNIFIPSRVSMLELGFAPTFYQFVDTIIEVKIAIKYTIDTASEVSRQTNTKTRNNDRSFSGQGKVGFLKGSMSSSSSVSRSVVTSQVNATYSQKFSYSAEGSSLLRTKLVPIPPPAMLEERVRQIMQNYDEERAINPELTAGS